MALKKATFPRFPSKLNSCKYREPTHQTKISVKIANQLVTKQECFVNGQKSFTLHYV